MRRKLGAAIESAGEAVYEIFGDDLSEEICTDTSEIAFELFRSIGLNPLLAEVDRENMPLPYRKGTLLGHEWVQVEGWNVDYGAKQFKLPFPFVTEVGSGEADALYGRKYTTRRDLGEDGLYPPVALVDEAKTPEERRWLWRTEGIGEVMKKAVDVFRKEMKKLGY